MARIFLSYAREDLAAAEAFAGALERFGHEVWWDHRLRAGSRFSWDIAEALRTAEAVVVLWSKASIESTWVQDEAAEGLERSRLVPVDLDGSKPPLGFRQYHTVDGKGWRRRDSVFEQLLAAIAGNGPEAVSGSPPPRRETAPARPAICVFPFANKSGDPEQDYFSDGITEDVITDLSKISALSVIDLNASVAPADRAVDLKQLANEFGVTHIVDGSVRKSAARLRITAQLIDTANGRSVWAERYERELSDVFAIQDEISHAIVEALQLTLLPDEKNAIAGGRTTSAEAYDLYLKARGLWPQAGAGNYRLSEEIVRLCTDATGIDSDYANAWALMALATAELRFWQGRQVSAIVLAERAIGLDPQMSEPHCVVALHFEEEGKTDDAEEAIERALKLGADSWEAHCTAGRLKFRCGNIAAAIPHLEKAIALSRKDHASGSMLIGCYAATGDDAGVRRAAEMTVARAETVVICDPADGSAFASVACGLAALGEGERAKKWIRKALNVDPGNLAMRYSLAATTAAMIDYETEAVEILEPFTEAARFEPHVRLLERDPSWAGIRDDGQFQKILHRVRKRVDAMSVSC